MGPAAKKIVIITAVATTILAFIPAYRPLASLILRSVALSAVSLQTTQEWEASHTGRKALNCFKVAVLGAGVAGVCLATPALITASLAGDLFYQLTQLSLACYEQDGGKALSSVGFLVIDALSIASICTDYNLSSSQLLA